MGEAGSTAAKTVKCKGSAVTLADLHPSVASTHATRRVHGTSSTELRDATFAIRLTKDHSQRVGDTCFYASMLRTAKAWDYCCHTIALKELPLPADALPKQARFFTGGQVRRIIAVAVEPYRTMFAIAGMTGLRAGEVMGLQKGDLDFEQRVIHVRRSAWNGRVQTVKSKASRAAVAMPAALAALLREYLATWQANPEGFLFLNRNGRPYAQNKVVECGLWSALDRLNLPHAGMHALRYCHASLLIDVGANPRSHRNSCDTRMHESR